MKKINLMLFGTFAALLFSCNKGTEIKSVAMTDRCDECATEHYRSPKNSVGEERQGYFDGREISYERIDGMNIMEGDIILTNEQLGLNDEGNPIKGTITSTSTKIWPSKKVYYKYATGLDQATKDKFIAAKAHWEAVTNIRFYLRTTQTNYINVQSGSGCSSSIGMVGGAQNLTLASGCSTGNAKHEIGHAIGLWHEHTRTYRDNYVTINTANIESGKSGNFTKCTSCTSNGTLDFNSIMMYDSYAFAISSTKPTIVKKDGSTFGSQRNALSTNDIAIVATKY